MADGRGHSWVFRRRFRRNGFGWRSQPAVQRVKEAVSEIKKVARKDPALGAEGAVIFLQKVSPALAHVDSSSGSIGSSVNRAIEQLVPIMAAAAVEESRRDAWLERLWEAYQEDEIPYIEYLGDFWGELCASPEIASRWADRLIPLVRLAWSADAKCRGFFSGTSCCLSALIKAERHAEVLELLELKPRLIWSYRQWGVKALVGLGRPADALRYAEASRGLNDSPVSIALTCEEILLSSGFAEDAYNRYGIEANRRKTYLATMRAVMKKYPQMEPAEVLADLVESTPGEEGKWFAAAKDVGLHDEAIMLARRSPCDPRTLTRAARDFGTKVPDFAVEAGFIALQWLLRGYGFDITGEDVLAAYEHTMAAATAAARGDEVRDQLRRLLAAEPDGDRFVAGVLGRQLGVS